VLNESVLDVRNGEQRRDRDRRVFTAMMQEELSGFFPVTDKDFSRNVM
jgi:hypothetical protein